MTGVRTAFHEDSAEPRLEQVPLAHLSLELGHLYMEDFARGPDHLRAHFAQVHPWVAAARADCTAELAPGRRARISTCFLVDDYFTRLSSPAVVIPQLVAAATENGLQIDYLARESTCARAGDVRIAELVLDRVVEDPPAGDERPAATGEPDGVVVERAAVPERPRGAGDGRRNGLAATPAERSVAPLDLRRRRALLDRGW